MSNRLLSPAEWHAMNEGFVAGFTEGPEAVSTYESPALYAQWLFGLSEGCVARQASGRRGLEYLVRRRKRVE